MSFITPSLSKKSVLEDRNKIHKVIRTTVNWKALSRHFYLNLLITWMLQAQGDSVSATMSMSLGLQKRKKREPLLPRPLRNSSYFFPHPIHFSGTTVSFQNLRYIHNLLTFLHQLQKKKRNCGKWLKNKYW